MQLKNMTQLYAKVGSKLVEIETIFERSGIPMSSITLFARNPENDKMTLILSSEKSNNDIRESFEIVMSSAEMKVEATEAEVLSTLASGV